MGSIGCTGLKSISIIIPIRLGEEDGMKYLQDSRFSRCSGHHRIAIGDNLVDSALGLLPNGH